MQSKIHNIIITGVGGQGLITLLQVVARAALDKGFDVRTSELHGLSQRGGSVSVHIRFGGQVFAPMIPEAEADLVLALETQEALAGARFASKNTLFLINQFQTPTLGEKVSEAQVKRVLGRITKKAVFVPAAEICQKELSSLVVAGMFLLGLAVQQKALGLGLQDIVKAIKKTMPEKFWQMNIKALKLANKF